MRIRRFDYSKTHVDLHSSSMLPTVRAFAVFILLCAVGCYFMFRHCNW